MGYEEELKVKFENPISIILTIVVVLAYILLFAVYLFNRPDPSILNMSLPLLYSLILWFIVAVAVVVAAVLVWR